MSSLQARGVDALSDQQVLEVLLGGVSVHARAHCAKVRRYDELFTITPFVKK
jgi:hypothetical protein